MDKATEQAAIKYIGAKAEELLPHHDIKRCTWKKCPLCLKAKFIVGVCEYVSAAKVKAVALKRLKDIYGLDGFGVCRVTIKQGVGDRDCLAYEKAWNSHRDLGLESVALTDGVDPDKVFCWEDTYESDLEVMVSNIVHHAAIYGHGLDKVVMKTRGHCLPG
jgi:hypothetical protein